MVQLVSELANKTIIFLERDISLSSDGSSYIF